MATTDFIAAIELGSSKIAGIAGKRDTDGSISVLAYAQDDASQFVHKGVIFNIDKAATALSDIIIKLETQLRNSSIAKVYVGVGGKSLRTIENQVSRTVTGEEKISEKLVDSISDENLAYPYDDFDILDVEPQEYKIDNRLVADPVGVAGKDITAHFLNIVARKMVKKNLELSFQQGHVKVAELVLAPKALGNAVLTETDRRLGCALVDLGAETTTVSVYKNNILRYLTVIPLGSENITQDIASLQMSDEDARQFKILYGDALATEEEIDKNEVYELENGQTISKDLLGDIVSARIEEILVNVWNQIQISGYDDKLTAGVFFTGGGCNLKNLEEAFKKIVRDDRLKIKTIKFIPDVVRGYGSELKRNGTLCTLFGLLLAGKDNCSLEKPEPKIEVVQPKENVQQDMFADDKDLKDQEAVILAKKAAEEERQRQLKDTEEEKKRRAEEAERKKKERERKKNSFFNKVKRGFDSMTGELFGSEDNSDKMTD
ncbi:MAG: cell division protein FtsA [Bacteroidaceae bacterium]|nr:cell division protein FtsA [Bacteroidaceae bacterium]